MPKDALEDAESFLKGIGRGEPAKPAAAPSSGGRTATAAPAAPSAPVAPREAHLGMRTQMGLGGARALANTAYGIGSLATYMSPTLGETVNNFRKSYPGISKKMDEVSDFGNSENKTFAESTGYWGTVAGLSRFAPGLGMRGAASRIVGAINPPRFMRGPWGSYWAAAPATRTTRAITAGGNVADAATKGAIGGAVMNPDDPKTGALGGAVLGPLPLGVGAAVNNPSVRFGLQHGIPFTSAMAAAGFLEQRLGIPFHLAHSMVPAISWWRSPLHGPIQYRTGQLLDAAGAFASVPPALAGYFSQPAGEVAKAGGEVLDATVGDYARDVGAKTMENIERRQ